MTSLINNNQCKLLILDIDPTRLNSNDLRTFFTSYGPIEWIEIFPRFSSAIIYFVSKLCVDRLVNYRTCSINQNQVRLRRYRFDQINWNIDCHTLRVKQPNVKLTELSLRHCFEEYKSHIIKINIFPNNHALVFFSDYDYLDRILLLPSNSFQINNEPLVLERMKQRESLQRTPILRNPVIQQLLNRIECLSRQLRAQPDHSRDEIERLEAELFILKNENALLKSKQPKPNIEQRLVALEDISNRFLIEQSHHKRSRSNSSEKQIKRPRSILVLNS